VKAAVMLVAILAACRSNRGEEHDFAAMQARGATVMGVDQYTSAHVFEDLRDGGRIILQRADSSDTAAIATIRAHLRDIATSFQEGDFLKPFQVHEQTVPGVPVLIRKKSAISYDVVDLPRGGEVRIRTRDPEAILAIHDFLGFQRTAHHAGGHQ
jgi:hypothetical protein